MLSLTLLGTLALASPPGSPEATLDALHRAVAAGDGAAWRALLTPDAMLLVGADRAHAEGAAHPLEGDARWSATPVAREVEVQGDMAWFDERFEHALGDVRDAGVLVRGTEGWRVAQLAVFVPDDPGRDRARVRYRSHAGERWGPAHDRDRRCR